MTSIPGVALVIIVFNMSKFYLEDKHKKALDNAKQLKRSAKDVKLQLIS